MKKYILFNFLFISLFAVLTLQSTAQFIPTRDTALRSTKTFRFINETPEGILGERKVKVDINIIYLEGQRPTEMVYLICNILRSQLTNIKTLADAQTRGYNINKTNFVRGKWETTLPHSGLPKDALNNISKIEYRGGQTVFCKWLVVWGDGKTTASDIFNFKLPRPINIAILGDSYGSGEGSPNKGSVWGPDISRINCHRSENAGQFRAVEEFARINPNIAVVYKPFFLSCSGATTNAVIAGDYSPGFCDAVANSNAEPPQILQLQRILDNPAGFKEDIQGKIDAVVISIGGNDAGFGDAVIEAFAGNLASGISDYTKAVNATIPGSYNELKNAFDKKCIKYVFATQYPDPTTGDNGVTCGLPQNVFTFFVQATMESLTAIERNVGLQLCNAGEAFIDFFVGSNGQDDCGNVSAFQTPNYDLLIEYAKCNMPVPNGPNVSLDNNYVNAARISAGFVEFIRTIGEFENYSNFVKNLITGCIPADGVASDLNLFSTFVATQNDIAAARDGFLLPLNNVIANKIREFQQTGYPNWHFVDGALDKSQNHGICRCESGQRYFNSLFASFDQQGTLQGTMHMNSQGQNNVYRPTVLAKLQEVLTPAVRRNMFNDEVVCDKSPSIYKLGPEYVDVLKLRDIQLKAHKKDLNLKFLKLKEELLPVIEIILKKFDPKIFGDQYKTKAFAKMREERLKK